MAVGPKQLHGFGMTKKLRLGDPISIIVFVCGDLIPYRCHFIVVRPFRPFSLG